MLNCHAGASASIDGLRKQNKAAGDAVEDFLGQIAPDESVVTGAEKMRTAAQAAVEKTKIARAEKAVTILRRGMGRRCLC